MNLKYMMEKSRYKFIYDSGALLYDSNKLSVYKRELSLYVRELYMYNISLKSLSTEEPSSGIRDELFNLAAICAEDDKVSRAIKVTRVLPIKELVSLSEKSQKYLEKWQKYILAYFILISSSNYESIISYFNLKYVDNTIDRKSGEIRRNQEYNTNSESLGGDITGIALKCKNTKCFIITPQGAFHSVRCTYNKSIGEICTGRKKKERELFRVPVKFIVLAFAAAAVFGFYWYSRVDRTVLIKGSFYMKLETNRWNKVISATGLNAKGSQISQSVKLFNSSLDSALLSIMDASVKADYIDGSSSVDIYITSDSKTSPDLKNTKEYLEEKKIKAIINSDGNELLSSSK
ncbi:MAG: hypothetical protein Q8930_20605 [Bacillota bacterium]|nr:hypothetical protein [Bacillota bacterium]